MHPNPNGNPNPNFTPNPNTTLNLILHLSPTSNSCHQLIWSPTSVTNIDVTTVYPNPMSQPFTREHRPLSTILFDFEHRPLSTFFEFSTSAAFHHFFISTSAALAQTSAAFETYIGRFRTNIGRFLTNIGRFPTNIGHFLTASATLTSAAFTLHRPLSPNIGRFRPYSLLKLSKQILAVRILP